MWSWANKCLLKVYYAELLLSVCKDARQVQTQEMKIHFQEVFLQIKTPRTLTQVLTERWRLYESMYDFF